jgi:hypothetical protein
VFADDRPTTELELGSNEQVPVVVRPADLPAPGFQTVVLGDARPVTGLVPDSSAVVVTDVRPDSQRVLDPVVVVIAHDHPVAFMTPASLEVVWSL